MPDWDRQRLRIRPLLDLSAPTDALAVYYTFYHDADRTELYVHEDDEGRVDGFVVVCQTGQRLFQPTVVLRTPKRQVAIDLLRRSLTSGRPYYLVTTPDLRDVAAEVLQVEQMQLNRIYRLDFSRYESVINVLIVPEEGLKGRPRFVIHSQGEVVAEAGISWDSPHFAELYVQATQAAEERGWGVSVLSACTRWAVRSARHPLYVVDEEDRTSIARAKAVGYADTGAREFVVEGVCCL